MFKEKYELSNYLHLLAEFWNFNALARFGQDTKEIFRLSYECKALMIRLSAPVKIQ
jgi:hypothetical protein